MHQRLPSSSPIASWAPISAQASGQPKATPAAATSATIAWLKRGARSSITSVSRQGSARRSRPATGLGRRLACGGAAEELVVGELAQLRLGDLGRVVAADRARRVALDLELGEAG